MLLFYCFTTQTKCQHVEFIERLLADCDDVFRFNDKMHVSRYRLPRTNAEDFFYERRGDAVHEFCELDINMFIY